MANFTVAVNKAGVTGLLFFIISIICIANASGDTEIHNDIRNNPAISGQHTLYCNGTWCIMNEQYCDKSANKCMACVYNKSNCTQHLDCLQYCIDKGVEQAIHENEGTATEENSTPAWALPSFVVFLIFFLVSFVGNVVLLWCFHQRKQDHHGDVTEEETSLTEAIKRRDTTEQKVTEPEEAKPEEEISLTEAIKRRDTTEEKVTEPEEAKPDDEISLTEAINGTETEEATSKPIQEVSSKSNEKSHEFQQ